MNSNSPSLRRERYWFYFSCVTQSALWQKDVTFECSSFQGVCVVCVCVSVHGVCECAWCVCVGARVGACVFVCVIARK